MSEERTGNEAGRTSHPFPSRREYHGSRIPLSTATGALPLAKAEEKSETASPTPSAAETPKQAPKPTPKVEKPSVGASTRPTGTPKVSRAAAEQPVEATKPVAPKASFPYPSRKVVHHTGQIPALTKEAQREPKKAEPPASKRDEGSPKWASPQEAKPKPVPTRSAPGRNGSVRPPKRATKRARKPSKLRVALILGFTVLFLGGVSYFAYTALKPSEVQVAESLDFEGPGEGSVEVVIMPGEMGTDIGQTLVDAGVVKSVEGFKKAFDNNSASATIKPGTYTLKLGMTSAAALAALLDEENRIDNAVTVNPGQTVDQVAEKLVQVGGFSAEEVEEALANTEELGLPEEAKGNLEGWLGAGSYELSASSTPVSVLQEMVQRTVEDLEGLGVEADQWETVLTKASVLEREVSNEEDLPKVARVIENRLADTAGETAGLLQMDSTVLYGVGKSGGIPTTHDLENDNPYNTYMKAGLPPGPIATPSLQAIDAALNPADGDWLYFVTINLDTGETRFASTIEEQTQNTELLKTWCEENPGRC